jgi:hypothetical protein
MSALPNGFDFDDGVYCFPEGMGLLARFSFVPGSPSVDIPPISGGRPAASLMLGNDGGVVSIQAVWDLSDDARTKLTAAARQRYPQLQASSLALARFSEVTATLLIGTGADAKRVGPTQTSGMEPYGVVIQATLSRDQKPSVVQAFEGKPGNLTLIYNASFKLDEQVKVRLEGDLAGALAAMAPEPNDGDTKTSWFWGRSKPAKPEKKPATLADCLAAIDNAIAKKLVAQIVEQTPNAPAALRQRVLAEVRDRVAQQLLKALQNLGENASAMTSFAIAQSGNGSDTKTYCIERRADLGAWFSAHDGASLITHAPK